MIFVFKSGLTRLYFISVRHKVKEIIELVKNDERLREERKKAKKNKDKYQGMSGDNASRFNYSKSLSGLCSSRIT